MEESIKEILIFSIVKLALGVLIALSVNQANGQTNLAFGGGLLEESRKLGIGVAVSATVSQDLYSNFGVSAIYTHGILETGYAKLITQDGSILSQNAPGTKFNQYQFMLYYKAVTEDEKLAVRFNGGLAIQTGEPLRKTLGVDIIAYPMAKVYPYLSWSPVLREKFYAGQGWSHTVTINLAIKL